MVGSICLKSKTKKPLKTKRICLNATITRRSFELFEIEKKKDMWCALRRKTLDSVSGTPAASVSVVCLGDPGIGKTSFIWSCALQQVDINHSNTTVSQYTSSMSTYKAGRTAIFSTIDVPICEAKNYFSDQRFFCTQGCLLCFKASEFETFYNVFDVWLPLIRHAWGDIAVLLIGLCSDVSDGICIKSMQEECERNKVSVCFTSLFQNDTCERITPWKDVYNKLGNLMFE